MSPLPVADPDAAPAALLAALRADAGSVVDGAQVGATAGAPDVTGLGAPRAAAVLAAWTGARLHAGQPGLLVAADPDVALLVGDWCFAHALQGLAQAGDVVAIGHLATAIGDCALLLGDDSADPGGLAAIWVAATGLLRA